MTPSTLCIKFSNPSLVLRDDFVVNIASRYFVTPQAHSAPARAAFWYCATT